jgi:hypothetical protein
MRTCKEDKYTKTAEQKNMKNNLKINNNTKCQLIGMMEECDKG